MTSESKDWYPCPCCGFLVFAEPSGSYAICPLCGWEDDHVQLRHPGMSGGANRYSLWEGQQRALAQFPIIQSEAKGYRRDPQWRPLEPDDLMTANIPQTGLAYFEAAGEPDTAYYWVI